MEKENKINGAIIEEKNLLGSFNHAIITKEKVGGRFALIPDLLNAKSNLVDLNYEGDKIIYADLNETVSASAIFYGKTRKYKTPILVIINDISEMLKKYPIILERSKLYKNDDISNSNHEEIRLIPKEFYNLESGLYGEVSIIDYATYAKKIKEMDIDNNYRHIDESISLNLEEAMNDEVIKALIPKNRKIILKKLLKVTEETIEKNQIKKYQELAKEKRIYRNNFLKIIHLYSVIDRDYLSNDYLNYTGKFIGLREYGPQHLTYKNNHFYNPDYLKTGMLPFSIDFDKKLLEEGSNFVVVRDENLLEKAVPTKHQLRHVLDTNEFWITDHRLIHQWIEEKEAKYKGTK